MAYIPILDSEVDAESPLTESLITRLRDNPLALQQNTYTVLTGSGTYTVPADVTKLKVIAVSGGAGGGSALIAGRGAGGGGGGRVVEKVLNVTPSANLAFSCGAGGAGGGSSGGNTTFDTVTSLGGYGGGSSFSGSPPAYGSGGNTETQMPSAYANISGAPGVTLRNFSKTRPPPPPPPSLPGVFPLPPPPPPPETAITLIFVTSAGTV